MNKHAKKSLIEKLTLIAEQAKKTSESGKRITKIINSEGITFVVADEYLDMYVDTLKTILKNEDWEEKFSEKYIDKSLQVILANSIKRNETNDIENQFDEMDCYSG